MRIGRIVAIGAGGALAVVGARKLRQARAARRSSSELGEVRPGRPLDPQVEHPLGEDEADSVLRPVSETA